MSSWHQLDVDGDDENGGDEKVDEGEEDLDTVEESGMGSSAAQTDRRVHRRSLSKDAVHRLPSAEKAYRTIAQSAPTHYHHHRIGSSTFTTRAHSHPAYASV